MSRKDERRPRAGAPFTVQSVPGEWNGTSVPGATDTAMVARCRCCSHRITDPTSVARGVGPDCWRRVLGSLRAMPRDAWRVRLELDGSRVARIVLEPHEPLLRDHHEELLRDHHVLEQAGGGR